MKQDDYQSEHDVVTKGIVSDIKHYNEQLKLVDEELEKLYYKMGCTLHTITGVSKVIEDYKQRFTSWRFRWYRIPYASSKTGSNP